MKNIYIKDLAKGMSLFGEMFAVKSFKELSTKNNKPYIDLELSDSTGTIKGKVWSESIQNVSKLEEGNVFCFDASVNIDSFGTQLNITKITPASEFNPGDFVPKSNFDTAEMEETLKNFVDNIKNPHLKNLVEKIVFDKDLYPKYISSPAAFYIHHAYQNGLLEHTVDMLKMSAPIKERYPNINYDLLVTGIIFHDLGKIFEYEMTNSISVTTKGKLLGHIYIGTQYVSDHAPKDIPQDLLDEVLHMILAHQGQLEYGSPIRPKTAEAVALYHLDDASTKINTAYHTIHKLSEEAEFSGYHKQLGVELYKSPYLNTLDNEDIPF